ARTCLRTRSRRLGSVRGWCVGLCGCVPILGRALGALLRRHCGAIAASLRLAQGSLRDQVLASSNPAFGRDRDGRGPCAVAVAWAVSEGLKDGRVDAGCDRRRYGVWPWTKVLPVL